ncbi:MAG: tetratricopeptide repeat protein [Pirellulales bacterium]
MSRSVRDDLPTLPFSFTCARPAPTKVNRQGTDNRKHKIVQEVLEDVEEIGIRRLYTVSMMADVLGVPKAAVRHWVRSKLLVATKKAGALEWFDFQQLVLGRMLARLLMSGFSLREIDSKLATLIPTSQSNTVPCTSNILIDGRRLSIKKDGLVLGAGGQLQFGFYTDGLQDTEPMQMQTEKCNRTTTSTHIEDSDNAVELLMGTELLDLAADLESNGEFVEAAEALRAFLQSEHSSPQVMFMLAELLYRSGDLTAARERYYATLEMDANHVEARTSLACVLAELGDHELALAALEGVLRQEPDYADAHWHIASVLHECGQISNARQHLRIFLTLAPESPWAAIARERLQH